MQLRDPFRSLSPTNKDSGYVKSVDYNLILVTATMRKHSRTEFVGMFMIYLHITFRMPSFYSSL